MTATDSHLLLRALVDEFARCGMEHACTSPGSRNTPIVLTLAREERLRTWSHVDERCSGFFALGAAKASGKPVAITCTSGTAAANLMPAVIEAHEAGIPLILLTADRPPELRDIGAGQTIDQLKLYGDAIKWFFEVGVQEATAERMRWIRSLACRAYWTALQGRPGPVHLNIPLREPLLLDEPLSADEPGGGGRASGEPWVRQDWPATTVGYAAFRHLNPPRAIVVAGDLGCAAQDSGRALAENCASAGVPLLADPLSGARSGGAAIAHWDLILRHPRTAAALSPEVVYRIGDLPTSKPLRNWLAGLDNATHIHFVSDERWSDPVARDGTRVVRPVADAITDLSGYLQTDNSDWLDRWLRADSAVAHAIAEPLSGDGLSEPAVATALGQFLPPEATLFVGASMPIRDVEEFFPALNAPPRVLANRGANGIDGTVSSAFGVAAVSDGPVVLLTGDVTLAHDLGGLLAAQRTGLKLTIVLINNDGGGIFNFLPISRETDVFEPHVATATGLDFSVAAQLFGCAYESVDDIDSFAGALMRGLRAEQTTIIEVRTERAANRALHAAVESAALAALRELRY
jgi:2-succinyl-5-enolpyruvyl-6-hydroxy-3-cyclohexene-1-carboxylate synthase